MSEDVLGRIEGDLAIMQRAMHQSVPFGRGILVFDVLLALVAASAALFSLQVEIDWLQQVPFAAIMVLVPIGLFVLSQRTNHDINMQVLMSVTIYAFVWVAASGYTLAFLVGPEVGKLRTALLYSTGVVILFAFTLLLVRAALKSREQHYCLGLALSTLVAGMLLPILGQSYGYAIAHGSMAMGFLTAFAIQRAQLREAASDHGAH